MKELFPGMELGRATRDAYGDALRDLGREHENIVVLDADLAKSTRSWTFGAEFPDRFFNVGIAESNLVGTASGLAASGHTALAGSFAAFLLCNAYDQIRMSVAFPQLNVKLVGSHAGISIGEDGPSQMGIEDEPPGREVVDKRIGRPEEIADIAQVLAAPASSYLVGETITVKGTPRLGRE